MNYSLLMKGIVINKHSLLLKYLILVHRLMFNPKVKYKVEIQVLNKVQLTIGTIREHNLLAKVNRSKISKALKSHKKQKR